ncbi:pentatricopeptide repeat-containing protein [Tripterygium wilfordii]|uniref:Pentatricopeptide repeat-containing protein n=1 Tax=Tripterygium wilfordii TaxID=458696 RepID=A0A7J7DGR8_TRIWF|nr:pentatricopeptide repeat-containing protein At3g12770-like [Tripterygium wilfordii]KAF5745570.1 pentatricopeptide repeat-containing protein [Tripterygium wilfordii]
MKPWPSKRVPFFPACLTALTPKRCYLAFDAPRNLPSFSSSSSVSPNLNFNLNLATLLQGHIPHYHLLQIHAHIYRLGAHQDSLIATRLIGHYSSRYAIRVLLYQLQNPDIFPFNAAIRVLAREGLLSDCFSLLNTLKQRSLSPNDFTFSFLLKSCSGNSQCVKQIHTHIVQLGFVTNSSVCNGLLAVYARGLKDMVSARNLFDEMPEKSTVCSWTSLIAGYAQSGQTERVLQLFCSMVDAKLLPEDDTMVNVLSACSKLKVIQIKEWVTILSRLTGNDDFKIISGDFVNTVLVYLCGKWGRIDKSREIFDDISANGKRSVLPWNSLINAYVQNGYPMEALSLFRTMMENPHSRPNHVTMVSVISACAQIGDLELGSWVHEYMKDRGSKGILESNTFLATALIDMYCKCGSLDRAKEVFDRVVSRDVVLFNAMAMGLATNGEGEEALRLFSKMDQFGLCPNAGTFLALLSACNHSGLIDEGRQIFQDMTSFFCIAPSLEHYACYIDLLARVGHVEEAFEVASSMPFEPNNFVWGALLGGCLLHSRVELAESIYRRLKEVDPENSASYVMLSNVFAVDRRWSDVSALRWFMRERGVKKQPGHSWISINGVVHEFQVGSASHPHIHAIYETLNGLVKEMKVPSLRW